jgi:hypothetical protein
MSPLISTIASLSVKGYGGLVTFGPPAPLPQGIWAGGSASGGPTTAIQKFMFSTETRTASSASLPAGRQSGCAMSRQGVGGYIAGGTDVNDNFLDSIVKYVMSTEVLTTLSATLNAAIFVTGFDNTDVAGYAVGGYLPAAPSVSQSAVNKLTYSSETRSVISGTYQIRGAGTTQNTNVAGYYCGGYSGSQYESTVKKMPYSTETFSTVGNLSAARIISSGVENLSTAGYSIGGINGSVSNIIQKINFSNDSISTLSATFPVNSAYSDSGVSYGSTAGYQGGNNSTSSAIYKLAFSNETTSTISATLSPALANGHALCQVS